MTDSLPYDRQQHLREYKDTPIFTRLLHQYNLSWEQNTRLWEKWDLSMYYKFASSGVCHCGHDMDTHPVWDNHSPVEMMYF